MFSVISTKCHSCTYMYTFLCYHLFLFILSCSIFVVCVSNCNTPCSFYSVYMYVQYLIQRVGCPGMSNSDPPTTPWSPNPYWLYCIILFLCLLYVIMSFSLPPSIYPLSLTLLSSLSLWKIVLHVHKYMSMRDGWSKITLLSSLQRNCTILGWLLPQKI